MSEVSTWVLVLIALNFCLVSFALWAVTMVARRLKALRRTLDEPSTKSLLQLGVEVAELTSAFASMSTTVRRLSSKTGMQDLRERRKGEQSTGLPANFHQMTPAEKKQMLRKALASGALHAVKDDGTQQELI